MKRQPISSLAPHLFLNTNTVSGGSVAATLFGRLCFGTGEEEAKPPLPMFDPPNHFESVFKASSTRWPVAIVREALDNLPGGPHRTPEGTIVPDRCALSAVEGWRGEILYWVRTGAGNRIERCKVKDPSVNNWPAVVEAVQGNIIADFPVINKSFNLSYSGTDR